ncbi:ribonuclease BN-like family protein [Alcanivorax hongdengensis A-11-3]|uniref:UPF0761 membrane protein A11A3_06156 n=1 Tax=Alcanivorax hongdengensis A-11-3 TaxID=1177179 RepID=L0WE66_9GAMM|nr:ribonuclease BN-like family protein [Alcanivorax hongdengensis A-11-3]
MLRQQFVEDGCRQSAAALTYTTLFAIVPVMTVSFTLLSAIPALKEKGSSIQRWAFDYFVPSAGSEVLEQLRSFSQQATNLTGIGILFLVVTAVLMLRTIEQSLNRIWKVQEPRKGLTSLMMYWAVLSLGPLCLGAGLAISSFLTSQAIFNDTVSYLGGVRLWLSILPFVFTTFLLTLLYTVVPNTSVPWRQGVLGAACAALLFELAKAAFAQFIKHAPNYQVVYGAFAAVPIFLLWIHLSWIIVLGGAELVRALVIFQEHRRQIPKMQSMLRLLELFWQCQQSGKTLRSRDLRREMRHRGVAHWDELRNILQKSGIIRRTDEGGYLLGRNLQNLTLGQLTAMMPWPAHSQLRMRSQNDDAGWEVHGKQRLDAAREGMMAELDISLDALFSCPDDGRPAAQHQAGGKHDNSEP